MKKDALLKGILVGFLQRSEPYPGSECQVVKSSSSVLPGIFVVTLSIGSDREKPSFGVCC